MSDSDVSDTRASGRSDDLGDRPVTAVAADGEHDRAFGGAAAGTGSSTGTGTGTGTGGAAGAVDDDSVGHVFDQTNGVVEGLDGDSDGTAAGDDLSAADRADAGSRLDDAAVEDDVNGVADRADRNP